MKLSKDQIRFIEKYLIKNEVKFWDVRLELLDHIVSSVEDKMSTDNLTFQEALLQVHRGFGNQLINMSRHSKHYEWTTGLYQANNGFKKFTRNKQKEIGRKYWHQFWTSLPEFLKSPRFLIEFSLMLLLVFFMYQYSPKLAAVFAAVTCYGLEFSKIIFAIIKRSGRKSLRVQMGANISMLFFSCAYFAMAGFGNYYKETLEKPYILLVLLFLFCFPFIRHSLQVFIGIVNMNDKQYRLLIS
jgi:hypothetical protein